MTHPNNLKTLIWTILLSIACGTVYTSAQDSDSEAMSFRVVPPQYPEGMEPEIVPRYLYSSIKGKTLSENQEEDNIILYPDKFRVWTTDTNAVYNVLGNRKFITNALAMGSGEYMVDCAVGDGILGRQLRDSLMNMPQVIRADYFGYTPDGVGYLLKPLLFLGVRLFEEKDSTQLKEITDSLGLRLYRAITFGSGPILRWNVSLKNTKESTTEIAKKLLNTGICERVSNALEIGVINCFTYDPEVSKQWGLYNLDNISKPIENDYTDLAVSLAWNYATGDGIKICVVDDGFDVKNKDLAANIIKCYNPATGSDTIPIPAMHGTGCAGIASAIRNNNYGISGVAPDAKLMLAIHSNTGSSKNQNNSVIFAAKAIEWAWKNGADVISCSWKVEEKEDKEEGYPIKKAISDAVKYGRGGKGCVIVKAAGNDGDSITYPGNIEGVINVGAIDKNMKIWPSSCFGSSLWVVAPGLTYSPWTIQEDSN